MPKFLFSKVVRLIKRFFYKSSVNNKLQSLAPTDDAEKVESYLKNLSWALLNSKSIKNIAIAGPYGAGKSSIIDTYIKKNKFTHKYLKISLATFQDLKEDNDTTKTKDELERLIELSLLQQFFYHEKDSEIPDSKFQKTKKKNKLTLFIYVLLIILFCISFAFVFQNNTVSDFISKYMPFFDEISSLLERNEIFKTIASIYILLFVSACIYRLVKLAVSISALKFSVPHAEIEIGKEISKSALNTYLDEILYFFSVSKYEVVFIEDLDRFEQSDIFVKLRELNQLINNSRKVKQDVVFVYAIKDDMFMNKERTKFFDFIIPVIPVINNSNSKDKLQTVLKSSLYTISEDLISDISIFIDDMRLLYNIVNEFYLYEQILGKSELSKDNLLAIITYKNLFPKDFVDLMKNEGSLYKAINKKIDYINKRRAEIDEQIKDVQNQITNSKNQMQKNIKELRLMYISIAAENLMNNGGQYFTNASGNRLNILQLVEDANFELFKTDKVCYKRMNTYGFPAIPLKFSDIEKQIDSQETYAQKEQNILDKQNPSRLYKKLEDLKNQKEQVQKKTIKDLIVSEDIELADITENKLHEDLIYRLLHNGYINENYLDYISIFHEGTLQKSDYDFLLKVKRGLPTNPAEKLFAKGEIIKQINKFDFEKESVLNYDLLDALLGNDEEQEKRQFFFNQFKKLTDKSMDFIDSFVNVTKYLELFIEELCSSCNDIWLSISGNPKFTKERQDYWFELIIKYANVDDIKNIFQKNDPSISEYENFFFICDDYARLEEIVSSLNIKFKKINKDTEDDELDFIFDNCFFELNPKMLEFMLSRKSLLSETYYTSNYKFITSCGFESLKKYIHDFINAYLFDVYLKIDKNVNEELQSYVSLLNNSSVEFDIKERLIQKVNTVIEDIKVIENNDVQDLLFKYKKIAVSWNNVYESYISHEQFFSLSMIEYLNDLEIAKKLSSVKISNEKDEEGNCVYGNFVYSLIHQKDINDESYALLTKSSPWWYSSFESEKLSNIKISILIKNTCVNPTVDAFNYLRSNFDGKQIELFEAQQKKLLEIIEDLNLTVNEVEKIVKSEVLDKETKHLCIKQLSDEQIANSLEISQFLVKTFSTKSTFDFSDEIKQILLLNDKINNTDRIKFFEYNHSCLIPNNLDEFIKSLGKEYEVITNRHKHGEIQKNKENSYLLDLLIKIGYISSKSETKNGYKVNHKIANQNS